MLNVITCLRFSRKLVNVRLLHQAQTAEKTFQEIKIPVPWGHIAGKWWGDTKVTPFIGLHGWEDNAGTYDNLAPLLKIDSFLALDSPGHGLSSYIPMGKPYYLADSISFVRRLAKYFNWEKISLIGHSHGSCVSYAYCALFPESVENYISIDCARTLMAPDKYTEIIQLRHTADNLSKIEKKLAHSKPPSYEYETLVDLLEQGSLESPTKESCKILLKRGSLPSSEPNKYYFSRDPRLRFHSLQRIPYEMLLALASKINCNYLGIRGTDGLIENKAHEQYLKTLEIVQKPQMKFEHHDVKGSHHLHLNNAERVAPIINKFLGYS